MDMLRPVGQGMIMLVGLAFACILIPLALVILYVVVTLSIRAAVASARGRCVGKPLKHFTHTLLIPFVLYFAVLIGMLLNILGGTHALSMWAAELGVAAFALVSTLCATLSSEPLQTDSVGTNRPRRFSFWLQDLILV